MKKILIYFTIFVGFTVIGCHSDNDSVPIFVYEFEAKVLGKGIDCGEAYLIDLNKTTGDSDIKNGTYYADNLPEELKLKGTRMKLNCRKPTIDEAYPCTTLGLGYFHVIVIESEPME